ncbi:MAG: PAS domain S-box protein, partial [Methanospirillaceae archaeon]|nr:PAS domain S-box protein [Methanospirillaceae archaeon]
MIKKDTGREGNDTNTGSGVSRLSTPIEFCETYLSVLCIGDVVLFPDLISDYIATFSGYMVRRAADGEEASVLLSAHSFDLIIYDKRIGDLKSAGWFAFLSESGDKTPVICIGTGTGELFSAEQDFIVAFSVTKSDPSRSLIPRLAEQVQAAREERRTQKTPGALPAPGSCRRLTENVPGPEIQECLLLAEEIGRTGCFVYDPVTGNLRGSPGASRIFGFKPVAREYRIEEIAACIPDSDRILQEISDGIAGNERIDTGFLIHPADGSAPCVLHCIAHTKGGTEKSPMTVIGVVHDITSIKQEEESRERPPGARTIPPDDTDVSFEDLFDINEIQRILDEFSEATGVASLITRPDGTPITRPAGFTRLCSIIRNTGIGQKNCSASDAALGKPSFDGPLVQRCLSGGLWGAGAAIVVGNRHVASWLIGQVRNEEQTEEAMRSYAKTIGVDEEVILPAFRDVPSLSSDAFRAVAKVMYSYANHLSKLAYKNLLQARVISEREKAEDALRRSEQNYRDVIENLEDIYYRTDLEGTLIEVSDSAARIFGYDSPDELLGTPIDTFWVEPEKRSEFIRKIREEGRVVDYEAQVYKKDRSVFPVSSTSTFYRDDTGTILGVVGIIRDISEQKKAHEDLIRANDELSAAYGQLAATDAELRLSMERLILQEQKAQETTSFLESLISIANVPIIIWDPSFQITRVNHAFELLVGRSKEEVLGKPLSILIPPDKADHTLRLLQTTLDGVRWETVELDIQHRDGSLKTVIWNSATLYDKAGEVPVATIAQGRDITEQRRLERANEEAIAQIQKNLAQLAILNDGIRNPLTIITVYADMIGESAAVDQIRTQVNNIDLMVTQLDQRWADSEKVLQVIRKHYQIDVMPGPGKDDDTGRDTMPPGTEIPLPATGSVQ